MLMNFLLRSVTTALTFGRRLIHLRRAAAISVHACFFILLWHEGMIKSVLLSDAPFFTVVLYSRENKTKNNNENAGGTKGG